MTEIEAKNRKKIDNFNKYKFIVGVVIFCAMLVLHVYVKDLAWYIWAMPFGIAGINPKDFIKNS